jgi:hypothetical protein
LRTKRLFEKSSLRRSEMFIAMAVFYLPRPVRGGMLHTAPDGPWKIKGTLAAINISSLRDFEHSF